MTTRTASLATVGSIVAFALSASLALAQTTGTTNNNSMYTLPGNTTTNTSGTSGLTGSTSVGTSNTTNTSNTTTGTTGTTNTSGTVNTTNPGLPNTGAGGDAVKNMMIILTATLVALGGTTFLVKRFA